MQASVALRAPRHQAVVLSASRSQVCAFNRRGIARKPLVVNAVKQTFSSFDDVIAKSDKPVLVDFYATWCGPCQMITPTLSSVAAQLKGKVMFIKVDTDKYPKVASKYSVRALPTLMLFKNGVPVDRIEGVPQEHQLLQRLTAILQTSK